MITETKPPRDAQASSLEPAGKVAGERADPTVTLLVMLTPLMLLAVLHAAASGSADTPTPRTAKAINPNTAAWPELAALPGIGEVRARAIVAHREAFRAGLDPAEASSKALRAFTRPADLQAVRGIGPKTVRRIAPYLRFD